MAGLADRIPDVTTHFLSALIQATANLHRVTMDALMARN
jgi:hypothetical protein